MNQEVNRIVSKVRDVIQRDCRPLSLQDFKLFIEILSHDLECHMQAIREAENVRKHPRTQ